MRIAASLFTAAVCCALLAAAPAAAADIRLPVGSSHGVRVVSHSGLAAFVFTPRAYRRVAGRRVSVGCTSFGPRQLAFSSEEERSEAFRAPKRRHTLETHTVPYAGADFCFVALARHRRRHLVDIPVTQDGAVFLDERKRVGRMSLVLTVAGLIADDRGSLDWPPAREVVEWLASRHAQLAVAELESPSATPPRGAVGYFSDGREHAAVVMLSAAGRRLYIELDADDTVRTNVTRYIRPAP